MRPQKHLTLVIVYRVYNSFYFVFAVAARGIAQQFTHVEVKLLSRDKIRPTGQSLIDSIGQTNRVLLNIQQDYSTRKLTSDIKTYFEVHKQAPYAQSYILFGIEKDV